MTDQLLQLLLVVEDLLIDPLRHTTSKSHILAGLAHQPYGAERGLLRSLKFDVAGSVIQARQRLALRGSFLLLLNLFQNLLGSVAVLARQVDDLLCVVRDALWLEDILTQQSHFF